MPAYYCHSQEFELNKNVRTAKRLKIVQIAQCHKHLGDNTIFENEALMFPKAFLIIVDCEYDLESKHPNHRRSQIGENGQKWPFSPISELL